MDNWFNYAVFLLFIVVSSVLVGYLMIDRNDQSKSIDNVDIKLKEVDIKSVKYFLEVVDTPALRQKGLMNRSFMDKNKGMLFVFEQSGFHGFWMKNTLIPLDMIWINDGEVVYIYENAQPCSNFIQAVCNSIIPTKSAKYVIELNAGQVKELQLKVGDKISL